MKDESLKAHVNRSVFLFKLLPDFADAQPGHPVALLRGCCLTLPHLQQKQLVLALLHLALRSAGLLRAHVHRPVAAHVMRLHQAPVLQALPILELPRQPHRLTRRTASLHADFVGILGEGRQQFFFEFLCHVACLKI